MGGQESQVLSCASGRALKVHVGEAPNNMQFTGSLGNNRSTSAIVELGQRTRPSRLPGLGLG